MRDAVDSALCAGVDGPTAPAFAGARPGGFSVRRSDRRRPPPRIAARPGTGAGVPHAQTPPAEEPVSRLLHLTLSLFAAAFLIGSTCGGSRAVITILTPAHGTFT